jgi:hypothetical protein
VGRTRGHVDDILVLRQDLRQGLDYVFDSFIRREQTELMFVWSR